MKASCAPLTLQLIKARVMADKPVMFQSSICAANGEIVITCHGATALVSPRRARPWQHVRKEAEPSTRSPLSPLRQW
jgi:hypothetical protein